MKRDPFRPIGEKVRLKINLRFFFSEILSSSLTKASSLLMIVN